MENSPIVGCTPTQIRKAYKTDFYKTLRDLGRRGECVDVGKRARQLYHQLTGQSKGVYSSLIDYWKTQELTPPITIQEAVDLLLIAGETKKARDLADRLIVKLNIHGSIAIPEQPEQPEKDRYGIEKK